MTAVKADSLTSQTVYRNVEEHRIGQLAGIGSADGDAGSQPVIKVYHMQGSTEGLEINEGENNYLSLHYTSPEKEVLFGSSPAGSLFEDIGGDSFGDEFDASQESKTFGGDQVRVGTTTRLSITYNVQKVDDQSAAKFMSILKKLLDDPELLLL